jgi:hypothetical protein
MYDDCLFKFLLVSLSKKIMTRLEKCKLAIEKGIIYNPETGKIFGLSGNEIGTKHKSGYIKISLWLENKCCILCAHQFAWYWINKECVDYIDHINGIKDDNRICNLRSVTHQQNQHNRKTNKGYCFCKKGNKYRTTIKLNYKTINIGYFNTEQEARNAYLEAKEKYHLI